MDDAHRRPGEFMSHPRWQRLIIAVAGPAMNIVLAVGLLTGVFMVHYEHPYCFYQPAVVGWCLPDSGGAKAGFKRATDRADRRHAESHLGGCQTKMLISPNQPLACCEARRPGS